MRQARKARELNAISGSRRSRARRVLKAVYFTKQVETVNRIMLIKHIITISLLSCPLISVATEEGRDLAEYTAQTRGRDCISQSSIRDYRVLDESNLIVTGSVRRKYHVALRHRAFGLRSAWQIGFKSPAGRVCPTSGEIVFDNGISTDRVSIYSIREIDEDELDELLVQFGKKKREFEQAPATVELDGAEVEELD